MSPRRGFSAKYTLRFAAHLAENGERTVSEYCGYKGEVAQRFADEEPRSAVDHLQAPDRDED